MLKQYLTCTIEQVYRYLHQFASIRLTVFMYLFLSSILYVTTCNSHSPLLSVCITAIDGIDGNGVVTLDLVLLINASCQQSHTPSHQHQKLLLVVWNMQLPVERQVAAWILLPEAQRDFHWKTDFYVINWSHSGQILHAIRETYMQLSIWRTGGQHA
jgi:hypothetical protein